MFLSLQPGTFFSSDLSCSAWPWVTELAERLISLNESVGKGVQRLHPIQNTFSCSVSAFKAGADRKKTKTARVSKLCFIQLYTTCLVCTTCIQILLYVLRKKCTILTGYDSVVHFLLTDLECTSALVLLC